MFLAYSSHYSSITLFDGGVRSAFFKKTSTGGFFASHPAEGLPLSGVIIDQVCIIFINKKILKKPRQQAH